MITICEHLCYNKLTAINEEYYINSLERIQKYYEKNTNSLITFIIPTLNRITLENTLNSLLAQKYKKWCGIIIFDNCYPSDNIKEILDKDERFLYISIKKRGCTFIDNEIIRNFSGDVRNIGMSLIKTDWIGYIDDDDTISDDYCLLFINEIKKDNNLDCIVFRMFQDEKIIPNINCSSIIKGNIGISFIYKTSLYKEGYFFNSCDIEDYVLLKELENDSKKIVILPYIKYFIRNTSKINYKKNLEKIEKRLKKIIIKKNQIIKKSI